MTALAAVLSAAFAFGAAALTARFLIPRLREKGLSKTPVRQKDGIFVPGLPAPPFGGLSLAAGLTAGALVGALVLLLSQGNMLSELSVTRGFRLLGGLVMALLMGAVGLLDDYRQARGLSGLSGPVKLLLQAAVAVCFLLAMLLCGDRSTILILPFLGQADLGYGYHPLCLLLILGAAAGGERTAFSDGTAATCAMVTGFSLALTGGVLGSGPAAVLGFALAGCALGLLLYSFPPAKLRCGKGGGMLLGGAAAAAALGCGVPVLLLPAALPWLCEGVYGLIRLFVFALTGKKLQAESLGAWLEARGLSDKGVSGVGMLLSLLGFVLTLLCTWKL
ncbi:MAG: hypothetical protein PUC47_01790 [Oscillospiraceae bacterium]|nr:hypothetical protein [Oscillospiraceae bacterium]